MTNVPQNPLAAGGGRPDSRSDSSQVLSADARGVRETAAARRQHGLDLAFRALARRELTVLELRRRLEAKRLEPADIDAVVADLQGQGYLDDVAFAARFAEDKRRLEGWGSERIARRLAARGVSREVADAAVSEEGDRASEMEAAHGVLRRRFPRPPDDARSWRSAYGVLVRKGYDPELAGDVLREYARGGAIG